MFKVRQRGFQLPVVIPQLLTFATYIILVGACYAFLTTTNALDGSCRDHVLITYSSVVLVLIVFFVWIELVDPANYQLPTPRSTPGEALLSVQDRYPNRCPYCSEPQGVRTKHCGHCNKCVHEFDHHCLYLNTCVGGGNYHLFVCLVLVSIILLVGQSGLLVYIVVREDKILALRPAGILLVSALSFLVGAVLFSLIAAHAYLRFVLGNTTYEFLKERKARHHALRIEQQAAAFTAAAAAPPAQPTPRARTPSLPEMTADQIEDISYARTPEEVFDNRASSFFGVSIPNDQ